MVTVRNFLTFLTQTTYQINDFCFPFSSFPFLDVIPIPFVKPNDPLMYILTNFHLARLLTLLEFLFFINVISCFLFIFPHNFLWIVCSCLKVFRQHIRHQPSHHYQKEETSTWKKSLNHHTSSTELCTYQSFCKSKSTLSTRKKVLHQMLD